MNCICLFFFFGLLWLNQKIELKLPHSILQALVWLSSRFWNYLNMWNPQKILSRFQGQLSMTYEALDCLLRKKYCVLSIHKVSLSMQIFRVKTICLSQKRKIPNIDWVQIISFLSWGLIFFWSSTREHQHVSQPRKLYFLHIYLVSSTRAFPR